MPHAKSVTIITDNDMVDLEEPFKLFAAWFDKAKESEPNDPNAMNLATTTKDAPARGYARMGRCIQNADSVVGESSGIFEDRAWQACR